MSRGAEESQTNQDYRHFAGLVDFESGTFAVASRSLWTIRIIIVPCGA
jgi:hypothetical protein